MLQCADVDDEAPHGNGLTAYDQEHLVIYLSLLDAETDGKDWREVARNVLQIDPDRRPTPAWRAWKTHLERAKWMTEEGHRQLLQADCANDP
jgi:hypothetical protein